jgi:hypothetical protein
VGCDEGADCEVALDHVRAVQHVAELPERCVVELDALASECFELSHGALEAALALPISEQLERARHAKTKGGWPRGEWTRETEHRVAHMRGVGHRAREYRQAVEARACGHHAFVRE